MARYVFKSTVLKSTVVALLAIGIGGCSWFHDRPHHGHHGHHQRSLVSAEPPRLVVQITVDQLRGDLPRRYADRFGEGGFRYLLEQGTWYTAAHYRHANTETAPGHATLGTGADPAVHGIVSNDWIDGRSGAFVYNTEDDRHHLIGEEPKAHQGVSPRNLLSSTFADELVLHTAGGSRVFSISAKDRGAILPGGHAGKAFWFSRGSGTFVTSTYYYDAYPAWAAAFNAAKPVDRFAGKSWTLLRDRSTYRYRDADDQPWEVDLKPFGRTFPHSLGEGRYLPLFVSLSPMVDELTLEFAKAAIENEGLGGGSDTDFLAVSFSATDYAGHLFGPGSLESEDTILRLDRVLADLFAFVDEKVGLAHTLIVLSADHGGVEAPEQAEAIGIEAGRMPLGFFRGPNPVASALEERFGRSDLILGPSHPYLYLDVEAIAAAGLDQDEVERFVVDEVAKLPAITRAFSRGDLAADSNARAVATDALLDAARRSFHPERSGHVHLVQPPYWFMHSTQEAEKMGLPSLAAIHGSPWAYDQHVPIVFAGHRVPARKVGRSVGPHEIAPTLAAYLGVKPPSGSDGTLLFEVLPRH
jgi:predicted AlkP superfamily pyrophosphatase or phosphodiesterase